MKLKKTIVYLIILLLTAITCLGILAVGMHSAIYQNKLFVVVRDMKRVFFPRPTPSSIASEQTTNEFEQLVNSTLKTPVEPPKFTNKTIVAFVFGQSNSANHASERYKAETRNVLNYFNGQFYIASDPLLGATGNGGSMWTITANKLIKNDVADKVILLPAGVGGTSIRLWRKNGLLNEMLENRLKDAKKNNLPISHFLWHQGETDNNEQYPDYQNALTEIINLTKRYYPNSKFFVAQASAFCPLNSSNEILQSQKNVTKLENVYIGPNTDMIGQDDRWDGCHFSSRGLDKISDEWVRLIKTPTKAN